MSETTYQWAIRVAREKRERELASKSVPAVDVNIKWQKSNAYKWGRVKCAYPSKTRRAYEWAMDQGKTRLDCLIRFKVKPDALRAFVYRNNLPKLKTNE